MSFLTYSHFCYGNLIWGCTNKTTIEKIFRAKLYFNEIEKNKVFQKYKILTIFEIKQYKTCLFIFKALRGKVFLNDQLKKNCKLIQMPWSPETIVNF